MEKNRANPRVTRNPLPLYFALAQATLLIADHVQVKADGPATMDLKDQLALRFEEVSYVDKIAFLLLGVLAMEIVNWLSHKTSVWLKFKQIPVRGKHLDEFTLKDKLLIGISKLQTGPFVYFLLRYSFQEPNILWKSKDISFRTILLPLPGLFIVFDFFYTIFHWTLHIKAIYGYIHKHHHVQKAPSRANIDAINVHPIEYFLGEYNHLWSLFLCCRLFHIPVHILGVILFLAIGGIMAGWNHTRADIEISIIGITIFDSKVHDVHHRIPQSNYGQYTMFWDKIFGTFRAYDPQDRVNPKAQLDPRTGKSLVCPNSQ